MVWGEPTCDTVDQTYETRRGNDTTARNHYELWDFPVTQLKSEHSYQLQFRIYNDSVAYRYVVPGNDAQTVQGESSSWKIMPGAKVWYFERLTKGWKLKFFNQD